MVAVNGLIVTGLQPDFAYPLENLAILEGRNASFVCAPNFEYCVKRSSSGSGDHHSDNQCPTSVDVLWIKTNWTILAINEKVVINETRLSVTHSNNTWTLNIRDVRQEDRGIYTCYITTNPVKRQNAFLEVVVPPDIILEKTSSYIMTVPEGNTAELVCKARGYPKPNIMWQREDNAEIISRISPLKIKVKVPIVKGEVLTLPNVTRDEMGAYLCIANNEVSPAISRRIMLHVHFQPMVQVPNQLIRAAIGTNVTLVCLVEGIPSTYNYWTREPDEEVITKNSINKYLISEIKISVYRMQMKLVIMNLQKHDLGDYKCTSDTFFGKLEGYIELCEAEPED